QIRAGDRSGVLCPVRLGAGANSFGHARGRKNKAFTAFSASHRHDFSSAFPTEPAVVGRVSDGQTTVSDRNWALTSKALTHSLPLIRSLDLPMITRTSRASASYPRWVAVYPRDFPISTCSMSLLPVAPLSKTSLRVEVHGAINFRKPQSA